MSTKSAGEVTEEPDQVEIRYRGRWLLVSAELFREEQFALGRYLCKKLGIEPHPETGVK